MATSSRFQRFKLLLWKHLLWCRYYWWWTVIEIAIRCFIALYIGLTMESDVKLSTHPTVYTPVNNRTQLLETFHEQHSYLTYTPSTPFTDKLMKKVVDTLERETHFGKKVELVKMTNEKEMEDYMLNRSIPNNEPPMGIVFQQLEANNSNIPNKLVYTLRQGQIPWTNILVNLPYYFGGPFQDNVKNPELDCEYWRSGVASVQFLINDVFTRMKVNSPSWLTPQPLFQVFPYPEYETTKIPRGTLIRGFISVLMVIEMLLSVPFFATIATEKRSGIRNLIKVYDTEEWMIWLCWFIKAFIVMFVAVTLMTILLFIPMKGKNTEVVSYVSFSVMWTFLLLYETANITVILLFGKLFNKAPVSTIIFMWLHYFCYAVAEITSLLTLRYSSLIITIFPAANLMKGMHYFREAEARGIELNLESLRKFRDDESTLTPFTHFIIFVADIIGYSLLIIIFSTLKSPMYYIQGLRRSKTHQDDESLQKVHRFQVNKTIEKQIAETSLMNARRSKTDVHEPLIRIENLSKTYGFVHALKEISLEFFENEINVILGHKRAGKSTLFSILTGITYRDHGSIYYHGEDISSNMKVLRSNLGAGFKEGGFFHYFDVTQNLIFYGMIKGLSKKEANDQVEDLLIKMKMQEKNESYAGKLSVNERKKLIIAAAMIGERQILLLDEPMAGLDPRSRVDVWNLLTDMRSHHTIIMTSNYDRETEKLADRITVLENGVVIAHGTPDSLKILYGNNYEILVSGKNMDFNKVNDIVHLDVDASIERETDQAFVFKVPLSESHKLSHLFENLETDAHNLGISAINVTFNTIQHLLMKTSNLSDHNSLIAPSLAPGNIRETHTNAAEHPNSGFKQIIILFKKRILYLIKDYVNILLRVIIPTVILFILIGWAEKMDEHVFVKMKLSPSSYINPWIMLHSENASPDLIKLYSNYAGSENTFFAISNKSNIIESMLEFAKEDIQRYRLEFIAAFELSGSNTSKLLYNLWPSHSLPVAITTYFNILLKSGTKNEALEIITYNQPTLYTLKCATYEGYYKVFIISTLLLITFGYFSSEVILYLFELTSREVVEGLMHLEIMSGVSKWIYWLTTFVFDLLFFMVVVSVRVLLLSLCVNLYNFFNFDRHLSVFFLFILIFGINGLLYCYIFSYFYKPVRRTYAHVFVFNFACSLGAAFFFLDIFNILNNETDESGKWPFLKYIILCLPFMNCLYSLSMYFYQFTQNIECQALCSSRLANWCANDVLSEKLFGTPGYKPYLEFSSQQNPNALLLELIFLLISMVIGVVVFILINAGFMDSLSRKLKRGKSTPHHDNADDAREEHMVEEEEEDTHYQVPLIIDGLAKSNYKWYKPVNAGKDINLVTQHGTCFAILGQKVSNAARLHIMTAKATPTSGEVEFKKHTKKHFSVMGYCPQTSPLLDKFTGREMLLFIASLKGIESNVKSVIDKWFKATGLNDLQHIKCQYYTDGSKRLLSAALSLVGDPKVIFLEEPAGDIDLLSRRYLYDIIKQSKNSGKVVVLSSNSPNECEILCDRLTVFVNGVMYCSGNLNELKRRFNLGYFIMIEIHSASMYRESIDHIEKNMMDMFGSEHCVLVKKYRGLLHYQITNRSIPLSNLFQRMEDVKRSNPSIKEYTISTTQLENIYYYLIHKKEFVT